MDKTVAQIGGYVTCITGLLEQNGNRNTAPVKAIKASKLKLQNILKKQRDLLSAAKQELQKIQVIIILEKITGENLKTEVHLFVPTVCKSLATSWAQFVTFEVIGLFENYVLQFCSFWVN